MRIVDTGVLSRGEPIATFPSVTRLADGSLLAIYRVGPSKESEGSVTQVRRSRDHGRTWSEPETPFTAMFRGVRGSLQVVYATVLPHGVLLASALWVDREAYPEQPLFHPETEGCLPMRVLVADSADDGRSWSEWREVAVTPDIGPPSLTSPALVSAVDGNDGRIIVSIETNKPYLDRSAWLQRVVHCESFDGGRTWSPPRTVCADPTGAIFHWDQRLAVASDGSLVAFSWTYEKFANRYLPIRRHVSRDGRTWVTDTLDFADQPSRPAVLPDGRAVLAWVDRFGSRTIRARAAPSLDGVFDPASEVVIYESPAPAGDTANTAGMLASMSLWSFGLPYAETLDGDVLVVYYAGSPDRMDIRWARLAV